MRFYMSFLSCTFAKQMQILFNFCSFFVAFQNQRKNCLTKIAKISVFFQSYFYLFSVNSQKKSKIIFSINKLICILLEIENIRCPITSLPLYPKRLRILELFFGLFYFMFCFSLQWNKFYHINSFFNLDCNIFIIFLAKKFRTFFSSFSNRCLPSFWL